MANMAAGAMQHFRPAASPVGMSRRDMSEILKHALRLRGFDPVQQLINLYEHADATLDQKITIAKILADKVYPSLKAVDLNQKAEGGFKIELVDYKDPMQASDLARPITVVRPMQPVQVVTQDPASDSQDPARPQSQSAQLMEHLTDAVGIIKRKELDDEEQDDFT